MINKTDEELAKILWNYNKLDTPIEHADCILGLGSYDTRVAERAAQIYNQGFSKIVIFSGGYGRLSDKSFKKPEAKIFSEIAIKLGVPKENILIEDKSTNTGENISFTKTLLDEKNIQIKSVILITKPYMERRAYATFVKQWTGIKLIVTSPQIIYEDYPIGETSRKDLINIIVGDTQRIKYYPEKGFMIKQNIPKDVWSAFEELVKRGYTEQLIKEKN